MPAKLIEMACVHRSGRRSVERSPLAGEKTEPMARFTWAKWVVWPCLSELADLE